jgi:hypothetical protein
MAAASGERRAVRVSARRSGWGAEERGGFEIWGRRGSGRNVEVGFCFATRKSQVGKEIWETNRITRCWGAFTFVKAKRYAVLKNFKLMRSSAPYS